MDRTLDRHAAEPARPADNRRPKEPLVVWRTWLLQPDTATGEPILTGLYGFRWLDAEMDAKCILTDRAPAGVKPGSRTIDRHHPVIPDFHCTCGIYAGRDELTSARAPLPPRRVPFATGFVELSGRVLMERTQLRAQHATIIGPLTVSTGRRPAWHGVVPAARAAHPRVVSERNRYRTLWTNRPVGEPGPEWLGHIATALAVRYGVRIETLS